MIKNSQERVATLSQLRLLKSALARMDGAPKDDPFAEMHRADLRCEIKLLEAELATEGAGGEHVPPPRTLKPARA